MQILRIRTRLHEAAVLSRAMDEVLSAESEFVARFLPLQVMTRFPLGFAAFAQRHHGQQPADKSCAGAGALAW